MNDLEITVVQIRGRCPVYQEGDRFAIVDGYKLQTKIPLCMHALAAILPWYVALSRGIRPEDVGLGAGGSAYVQCPDPCDRTGGGTVVFAITRRHHA